MRVALILVLGALQPWGAVAAQDGVLRTSGQSFTFGDPSGVGLRSYSMIAATVRTTVPVRPWLSVGGAFQRVNASMGSVGAGTVDLSGMTDAEGFALLSAGPVGMRAGYLFGLGRKALSSDEEVVAGLAANEFLPFPVRAWSAGGGFSLEGVLPIRRTLFDIELRGGVRTYRGFEPFSDDPSRYQLGGEKHAELRVAWNFTALTRVEAGVRATISGSDNADVGDVFEPGSRVVYSTALGFPIGRTGVLLRAQLYSRTAGNSLDDSTGNAKIAGAVDSPSRRIASGAVEARSRISSIPVVTSIRARVLEEPDEEGSGQLMSVGVGTEMIVHAPWSGLLLLTPTARFYRGRVVVLEGYESTLSAWEFSLTVRWEPGR